MTSGGNQKTTRLNLRIPSQTEKLNMAREFVADAAKVFGFEEDDVNNIALAVDEACTNIIKHAYSYAADKEIDIVVSMKKPEFEILIEDQHVEAFLGRKAGNTLGVGGDPAKGSEAARILADNGLEPLRPYVERMRQLQDRLRGGPPLV